MQPNLTSGDRDAHCETNGHDLQKWQATESTQAWHGLSSSRLETHSLVSTLTVDELDPEEVADADLSGRVWGWVVSWGRR